MVGARAHPVAGRVQGAIGGLRWTGASVAVNVGFQLLFTAAMARMLAPADFGLIAMSLFSLRFFSYFSQAGLGPALVQRASLSEADVQCALGLALAIGGAGALAVAASAPLAGWFYRNEMVVAIQLALAANLLVLGVGAVPAALLRRELRFRELAQAETASYVIGYGVVGVGAAWAGWGVWSLVASAYGQSLIALAFTYAGARHSLKPTWRGDKCGLLGYGGRHSVIGFVEFLSGNIDAALIGRLLGESVLGLYSRAQLLANQPVEKVAGVVTRVLFPLLAGAQGERALVASTMLLGVWGMGLFGSAFALALCAAAPDVVRTLLGEGWGGAVPVVRALALAVPFIFMSNIVGVTCDALALLAFKLRVQGGALVVITALLIALYPLGPMAVAGAIVLGELLRFVVYMIFLRRTLALVPGDLVRALGGAATGGLVCGCTVYAVVGVLAGTTWVAPVKVLVEVAAGVLGLVVGAALALRLLRGSSMDALARRHFPAWGRVAARMGG